MREIDSVVGLSGPQLWIRPGLSLTLWPAWLHGTGLVPRELQDHLQESIPWQQPVISVYGRRHPVPRLTCWVGDQNCTYTYSGLRQTPHPWTPPLTRLRHRLESHLGVDFNSLLLNRYRDGHDRMGWHADDEPELSVDHPIASLSLGASRTLRFRPTPGPRSGPAADQPPLSLELHHGDLLVMNPPTQEHWQHAVPQRLRLRGARFNLTFRRITLPPDP